jgi:hypothetical protein
MFTHPYIANQPARQRQREILAQADQQRLLRFLREHARASRRAEQAGRRITRLLKHTRPAALPHEPHRSCQQPSTSGPVMTTLIALAAICILAACVRIPEDSLV